MMRKLYDLARGTVKLRVSGPQPERILNFCAEHGIEFRSASPCRDFSMTFSLFRPTARTSCPKTEKTGLR